MDLPFLPMLVVGAAVAAVFGIALGAPTLRLRGDYLAIMTLGFGEIVPIVFLNLETLDGGHERHRRHLPARAAAAASATFSAAHAVRLLHRDGRASSRSR